MVIGEDVATKRAKYRESANRFRAKNPAYAREYMQQWRFDNPEKYAAIQERRKENSRRYSRKHGKRIALRSKYGLTLEQYQAMCAKGCGICGSLLHPRVDHCHKTGKVRGILCAKHNQGLGHFNDDLEVLKQAIRYLEETNG